MVKLTKKARYKPVLLRNLINKVIAKQKSHAQEDTDSDRKKLKGPGKTKGELEIKPSKFCQAGDTVWILSSDDKFIKTIIF